MELGQKVFVEKAITKQMVNKLNNNYEFDVRCREIYELNKSGVYVGTRYVYMETNFFDNIVWEGGDEHHYQSHMNVDMRKVYLIAINHKQTVYALPEHCRVVD